MRTLEQIAETDREAEDCRYVAPPAHLEPKGRMFEDPTWKDLTDFFERHTHHWPRALRVYVSRRFDEPYGEVYANVVGFVDSELRRKDIRDDPDAHNSYGN